MRQFGIFPNARIFLFLSAVYCFFVGKEAREAVETKRASGRREYVVCIIIYHVVAMTLEMCARRKMEKKKKRGEKRKKF